MVVRRAVVELAVIAVAQVVVWLVTILVVVHIQIYLLAGCCRLLGAIRRSRYECWKAVVRRVVRA